MESTGMLICPHCGYAANSPDALYCASCRKSLTTAPAPFADTTQIDWNASSSAADAPPMSAAPYPAAPPRPQPTPPPPAAPSRLAQKISGDVTSIHVVEKRPPQDTGRWLTWLVLVIGLLPLLAINKAFSIYAGAAIAIVAAGVGIWIALSAFQSKRLVYVTIDTPARMGIKILMIDPNGQPEPGDAIEAQGKFLSSGQFFSHRMRVTETNSTSERAASPLAQGGAAIVGKGRVSLLTPAMLLLFFVFFWLILFLLAHTVGSQYLLPIMK